MARGRKLGELLTQAGLIDEDQLRSALGEQRRWGNRLGITLVRMGFLREADLLRTLSRQLGVPVARLDGKRIAPEVLRLVPVEIAEKHGCIPLFTKQEQGATVLYVGTENPCDLGLIDDLAFRTGCRIRPVLMGPLQIAEAVAHHYGSRGVAPSPQPESVSETRLEPSDTAPFTAPPAQSIFAAAPQSETRHELPPLARPAPLFQDPNPEVGEPADALDAAAGPGAEPTGAWPGEPRRAAPSPPPAPQGVAPGDSAFGLSAQAPLVEAETPTATSAAPRSSELPSAPAAERPRDVPTRTILRAVTQLLIEKGVIRREELIERLRSQPTPRTEGEGG